MKADAAWSCPKTRMCHRQVVERTRSHVCLPQTLQLEDLSGFPLSPLDWWSLYCSYQVNFSMAHPKKPCIIYCCHTAMRLPNYRLDYVPSARVSPMHRVVQMNVEIAMSYKRREYSYKYTSRLHFIPTIQNYLSLFQYVSYQRRKLSD